MSRYHLQWCPDCERTYRQPVNDCTCDLEHLALTTERVCDPCILQRQAEDEEEARRRGEDLLIDQLADEGL